MNKKHFIRIINSLPANAVIIPSMDNNYGVMEVKIFTEKTSKDFIQYTIENKHLLASK